MSIYFVESLLYIATRLLPSKRIHWAVSVKANKVQMTRTALMADIDSRLDCMIKQT